MPLTSMVSLIQPSFRFSRWLQRMSSMDRDSKRVSSHNLRLSRVSKRLDLLSLRHKGTSSLVNKSIVTSRGIVMLKRVDLPMSMLIFQMSKQSSLEMWLRRCTSKLTTQRVGRRYWSVVSHPMVRLPSLSLSMDLIGSVLVRLSVRRCSLRITLAPLRSSYPQVS